MQVFNYNRDVVEGLISQKKRKGLLTVLGNISLFLILYFFDPFDYSQESATNFIVIVLFLGVIIFFLVAFLQEAKRINQIILNVQKNKVTLMNSSLQIVYTADFTKSNAENFVEIPFTDIKNVELIVSNLKNLEYCNLVIFTSTSMYKLCIEDSVLARSSILDMLDNNCPLDQSNGIESRRKWVCKCGRMISSSVCPFCGENYEAKNITEDGLKIYIENELKKQQKSEDVLGFFKVYLDCIYGNASEETIVNNINEIIGKCPDFIDKEYLPIMLDVCNKKLNSLQHWRCLGCGKMLSIDIQECDCGYKRS